MESKNTQDTRDVFEALCSKYLNFIFEEFHFKTVLVKKNNCGCFITYQNGTTALKASLCPQDGRISMDLYRLVDGLIPKYPLFFDRQAELLVFNLDMLALLKTRKYVSQKQEDLFKAESIERIIKEYAELLKEHAAEVLRGDFSILPEVKETIARHAKELEHEQ